MNKFLLLATILAMAASVSYAMPAEIVKDEDVEIDNNAEGQWVRSIGKFVGWGVDTVKSGCKFMPVVKSVCGDKVLNDKGAEEQVCDYVPFFSKFCMLVNIIE